MTVHLPLFNSLAQSISVSSLVIRPFSGPPTSEKSLASHAYQSCQLTNGRAGWPADIWIKEGRPSSEHSFIQRSRQVPSTSRQQERRNYIQLPGYDALWTGHYIAQQNTTPDCPATTPRRPGTTRLSRVHYLEAHSPATTSYSSRSVTLFSACSQHRWGKAQ
jgi:hypothetical protein